MPARIRPAAADVPAIEGLVAEAYGPCVASLGVEPGPLHDDYAARVKAGQAHVLEMEPGTISGLRSMHRHAG